MKTKLYTPATLKSVVDREKQIVHVISSTGDLDRHGESVNPQGWKIGEGRKAPSVLVAHDYWSLPVGKIIKSWIEGNELHQHVQLAETDEGKKVFYLVDNGYLNTVSVGFIVLRWGRSGEDAFTIMEQEQLELSFVAVPANPNATVQDDVKEAADLLYKSIEQNGYQKTVQLSETELRSIIADEFTKAIEGKKIVEEKAVEVVKYIESKGLPENAIMMLLQIQKTVEKSKRKTDAVSNLLNGILNIKTSDEGGATTT